MFIERFGLLVQLLCNTTSPQSDRKPAIGGVKQIRWQQFYVVSEKFLPEATATKHDIGLRLCHQVMQFTFGKNYWFPKLVVLSNRLLTNTNQQWVNCSNWIRCNTSGNFLTDTDRACQYCQLHDIESCKINNSSFRAVKMVTRRLHKLHDTGTHRQF